MKLEKFEELDRKDWEIFRMGNKHELSPFEFTLLCELHAKYYGHKFYKPCTCNPKVVNRWIKDLNIIWDNNDK